MHEVQPPPQFQDLEPAVQEQFIEARERLASARNAAHSDSPATLGRAWGEMGQWFHVYRYPDSAMRCYREATRLDPAEPRWPYYLGLLAVDAGELDSAVTAFELAVERAPQATSALNRLADLELKRQKADAAEAYYRRALAIDSGSVGTRLGLARLHLQSQDAAQALEVLAPLTDLNDRIARHVHYLRAQAYRLLGDLDRAREHLSHMPESMNDPPLLGGDDPWIDALAATNLSSTHISRLAMQAYRRGNYRQAVRLSGRAARLNPHNPELRANHAAALLGLGRPRDALEQAERAIERDPDLARAWLIKAGSHIRLNQSAHARDSLLHALDIDPGMKEARQQLGRVYQQMGQIEKAVEQYGEMRSRFGQLEQVRFWHAALHTALGHHDRALEALAEDLAVLPRSRLLQLLRIRLLAAAESDSARDPARASRLLKEIGNRTVDVFHAESAAMVAAAVSDFERAVAWQRRAVATLETVSNDRAVHVARRRLVLYEEGKPCLTPWEREEVLITKSVRGLQRGSSTQ